MGLFKKNDDNSFKTHWAPGKAPERSCLDCKYCDTEHAKNDQIYCKWDSEYYYPETGISCDDFNR